MGPVGDFLETCFFLCCSFAHRFWIWFTSPTENSYRAVVTLEIFHHESWPEEYSKCVKCKPSPCFHGVLLFLLLLKSFGIHPPRIQSLQNKVYIGLQGFPVTNKNVAKSWCWPASILGGVDRTDFPALRQFPEFFGHQAGAMARGSTYQVEPMISQVMRCLEFSVFEFWWVAWYLEIYVKGDLPGTPKDMGPPYGKRDPYYSHIFRDSNMGVVWE